MTSIGRPSEIAVARVSFSMISTSIPFGALARESCARVGAAVSLRQRRERSAELRDLRVGDVAVHAERQVALRVLSRDERSFTSSSVIDSIPATVPRTGWP